MRAFLCVLCLGMAVGLSGCGPTYDGWCNHCPNYQFLDTDGCLAFTTNYGCDSAEVTEVTDTTCALGAAPITHMICEFEGCSEVPDCTEFASAD